MQPVFRMLAAALCMVALAAPLAQAQDYTRPPAYGSVTLNAGFHPDPRTRTIQAGGDIWVSTQGGACQGYVANAPDYRVYYNPGRYELSFYVRASRDTILLINAPDGRWYCNDDYSGLNPALVFRNPMRGQYDIWVGTYNRTRVSGARLYITEMRPFSN